MDWLLYGRDLRHERFKNWSFFFIIYKAPDEI